MNNSIPSYKEVIPILLRIMIKNQEYTLNELVELVSNNLGLQKCDIELKTLCGRQSLIKNRVIFAKSNLMKKDLIKRSKNKKYSLI